MTYLDANGDRVSAVVLDGLQECAKAGIVHRDLSLANVLVKFDPLDLRLIDFGCCQLVDNQLITLTDKDVGTPGYRAPECEAYSETEPTIQADLYSAGKLLWSMVTGDGAFQREEAVFKNLTLSKKLPDASMTWHLHHVFEKTIRHSPGHRYKTVQEAIGHGNFVLNLVRQGYPPLETVNDNFRCPVCGVGSLANLGHLVSNRLTNHESWSTGKEDSELKKQLNCREPPAWHLAVCTYCGFAFNWYSLLAERNMKYRDTLK